MKKTSKTLFLAMAELAGAAARARPSWLIGGSIQRVNMSGQS